MKKLLLIIILIAGADSLRADWREVPSQMNFCGMRISLNSGARSKVDEIIDMLKRSPDHFQVLLDRANLYMPFVEDGFKKANAPLDLIYIALVESSLNGNAVSRSNAVGYWQFKELTGKEMGLQINSTVDERKHIYYASYAAAKYFKSANTNFRNWIYAVIAYNQGPTGAIPHTQKKYYGKSSMPVSGSLHRYALKALAYKLAFEKDLYKSPVKTLRLVARRSDGETSVSRLAKRFDLSVEELKKYNPWILRKNLPAGKNYMVFVPSTAPDIAVVEPEKDPFLDEEGYDPGPDPRLQEKYPIGSPEAKANIRHQGRFAIYPYAADPDYGVEYVILRPGEKLVEIGVRYGVKARKLREWNDLNPGEEPEPGTAVQLKKSKRVRYHFVKKGETLKEIAALYEMDLSKLRKKNRMSYTDNRVYAGQKLYLKKRKSKGEKIILIDELIPANKPAVPPKVQQSRPKVDPPKEKLPDPKPEAPKPELKEESQPQVKTPPKTEVKPEESIPEVKPVVKEVKSEEEEPELRQVGEVKPEEPARPKVEPETRPVYKIHTVAAGETLWRISQNYGVTMNEIKAANGLADHGLSVGQRLKIPVKKP